MIGKLLEFQKKGNLRLKPRYYSLFTEYPTEYVRVTNKINIIELNKTYEI